MNYYSDIDESLNNKIKKSDTRIEQINKKNFEDETYIRMKFELSKFLQIKDNIKYLKEINDIINSENKNIIQNRSKMLNILNSIYSKLVIQKKTNIDYYNYKTPNKRIPCFARLTKSHNKNIKLTCGDDPHCIQSNNSCKLFIDNTDLLEIHKDFSNYNYYIAKIVDELLRYKMKRDEILNDNIPIIINKEIIEENKNKYIIIHSINNNEINNIIDKLFLDTKGVYIDKRNLYEEITTKEIAFRKGDYIKSDISIIQDNVIEELSVYWLKIFGNKFKIKLSDNNTIFTLMASILNYINTNTTIDITSVKNSLIKYIKDNGKNEKKSDEILDLYKKDGDKIFKYITSIQSLIDEILSDSYSGCETDLEIIAKIYNINIILLDKRIKKNQIGYKLFNSTQNKSNYYVLIYKSIIYDKNIYNLIQYKNKIKFKINELPEKLVNLVIGQNVNENEK